MVIFVSVTVAKLLSKNYHEKLKCHRIRARCMSMSPFLRASTSELLFEGTQDATCADAE
jgi:hypothetical protein